MTIDKDPPRLSDSGSPDDALLRTALRQARSDISPEDALERMLARFPLDPGPGGGDGSPAEPPGKGAIGKGAVGKGAVAPGGLAAAPAPLLGSVIIGALAGAFVSFGLWITDADTASPRPSPPTSLVAPSSPALSDPHGPAQAPSDSASPRGSRPAASPAKSAPLPAASEAGASAQGSPAPADTAGSDSNTPGSVAPVEPLETEGALLARAQALVGANPAGALALTEEHRSRFPRGTLGQEREVLAITALAGMGRSAEARARAEAFLSANPSSAHRRRLARIVPGLEPANE